MLLLISEATSVYSFCITYILWWSWLAWSHKCGLQNTQAINFSTSIFKALWPLHGQGPTVVFCACATSEQVAWSAWKMKHFILRASSELASDRTVFGPASSCAPPFNNAVPFFLLGDHPVYQRSSLLRLARTLSYQQLRFNILNIAVSNLDTDIGQPEVAVNSPLYILSTRNYKTYIDDKMSLKVFVGTDIASPSFTARCFPEEKRLWIKTDTPVREQPKGVKTKTRERKSRSVN